MQAQDPNEAEIRLARIDATALSSAPGHQAGLVVLPVAAGRIFARWTLDEDAVEKARLVAANDPGGTSLVLRAFRMPGSDANYAESVDWQDFSVDALMSQGYFDLKGQPGYASAVLGVKGPDGHFRGLLQGDTVALPLPAVSAESTRNEDKASLSKASNSLPELSSKAAEATLDSEDAREAFAARELAEEYQAEPQASPGRHLFVPGEELILDEALFPHHFALLDEAGTEGDVLADAPVPQQPKSSNREPDRLRYAAVNADDDFLEALEEVTGFTLPTTAAASARHHLSELLLDDSGTPPDFEELTAALPETPSLDEAATLKHMLECLLQPGNDLHEAVQALYAIEELSIQAPAEDWHQANGLPASNANKVEQQGDEGKITINSYSHEATEKARSGASELLASNWADMWGDNAPIQLRASFVICGRLAAGLKLILAGKPVKTLPGGRFIVRQPIKDFSSALQLMHSATQPHEMAAGPALEALKSCGNGPRVLEIHAALDVEGHLQDPSYAPYLPKHLHIAVDGSFRVTRFLPHGAVVLPGLVLVGDGDHG